MTGMPVRAGAAWMNHSSQRTWRWCFPARARRGRRWLRGPAGTASSRLRASSWIASRASTPARCAWRIRRSHSERLRVGRISLSCRASRSRSADTIITQVHANAEVSRPPLCPGAGGWLQSREDLGSLVEVAIAEAVASARLDDIGEDSEAARAVDAVVEGIAGDLDQARRLRVRSERCR